MALVTKPFTHSPGDTILSAETNSNFNTLYDDYNGNITNANISASANIGDTKLAQISTAGKVSGAALTSLSSIPSDAGAIPAVNVTDLTLTSQAQGDIIRFDGSNWIRLAVGTANQILTTDGTDPSWGSLTSSIKSVSVTSTGSGQTITGMGFKPTFLIFMGGRGPTTIHGALAGMVDSSLTHFSFNILAQESDNNTGGGISTSAIIINDLSTGTDMSFTVTSLDSDGFTYNVTNADSNNTIRVIGFGIS